MSLANEPRVSKGMYVYVYIYTFVNIHTDRNLFLFWFCVTDFSVVVQPVSVG